MIAPVQTRLRPVFCVIEHAHCDRALAEAVSAGCFTHAGITLGLGVRPDWLTAPFPRDEEWRIEWSKFYYGLDLAVAFRETGDEGFLRSWENLVESWIEQVPTDFDASDVTGRRIQNWIYAWNIFEADESFPGLSEGLDERIVASIREQAEHLRQNLSAERNHRTLELYALFIAALALPEIDNDGQTLSFSINELCRNLLADIRADGVHREHSTHYHMVALRSFLAARINAERFGLILPREYDERLERACEFALHCHRPDGAIPALSDSDTGSYLDVLELAATLFSRADFLWVATKGNEGAPPERKYASFGESGYCVQRSGWGEGSTDFQDERFLIFDCGPVGDGGHGHYDALSVEIAAGGRPLIVDPGRYTYFEGRPNWRRWFKGTAAHNTVCIDGLDQTPYRRGKPKGPVAEAQFIERLSAPGFDLICGRVESPSYEAIHTRFIFFIADEYWVMVDQLRGERPHNYDLRFHLAPEAMNHTSFKSCDRSHAVVAPGVALVFAVASKPGIEPGWLAPKYGEKMPAPVVSVRADGVASTDFFTLIAPRKLGDPPPTLRAIDSGDRISFAVSGVGQKRSATDHVAWGATAEPFRFGRIGGSARATWRRASAGAASSVFRACEVERLAGATALVANARPLRWLMCDEQDGLTRDDEGRL
jgi:hypothetical protein